MTKSSKSKILALALCAGVMSGIYASPVLAAWGNENVSYDKGSVSSDIGDLNNPSLHHPNGPHDDDADCGEEVDGTDVKIGDLNKVIDDLVANDTKVANELSGEIDKINEKIEKIDVEDTDTHVKDGTYEAADNGDVTMDIVDKDGKDTGKDVTISGLASDKELADQKSEFKAADKDLQDQIDKNAGDIEELGGKVDGLDDTVNDIKEQIDNIDVKDTNTQVNEGTYTAEADGTVSMDVVDKTTGELKEDAITIEGLASDSELAAVEGQSKDRDKVLQGQIDDNKQAIADETAAREEADAEHDRLLADHKKQIEENAQAIADETAAREEADEALQGQIDAHGQQIGDNTAAIKNHTSVIGVEDSSQLADKYADTNYISDATSMVEADKRLDAAISDVSTRVDGIENRVDGLEDRIDKVGAMSAAIANLRTMGYDPAAPTEVAVGVGQYRDETGMALGLFHYPNRDFMLSLSVSTSGDEYMGGIGATWKFGRKSPEKVAEIKKAQAEADARRAEEQKLAKAEEMKKAAKEAKVQAQMERHAKLAAERAALEEA